MLKAILRITRLGSEGVRTHDTTGGGGRGTNGDGKSSGVDVVRPSGVRGHEGFRSEQHVSTVDPRDP